jgi:lathosterol oxidase
MCYINKYYYHIIIIIMSILIFLYDWFLFSIINAIVFSVLYIGLGYLVDTYLEHRTNLSTELKNHDFWNAFKTVWTICPVIGLFLYFIEYNSLCYNNISDHGIIWWFCSIILYYLLNDCFFYWLHRILHTDFVYKVSHCVHHYSKPPTVYTALSSDVIEFLSEGLISGFFPGFIIPIHYLTLRLLALSIMVWSCLIHAETHFVPEFLQPLVVTSKYHHVHHKYGRKNYNFSMVFTIWDKLCGTFRVPETVITVTDSD